MIVPLWQKNPPKTSGGTHETPNTNKAGGEWLLGPLRCSGRQGHGRWFHDLVLASSPWWPCQLPLGCEQADGCGARGKCCWAADVFHMFVRAWKSYACCWYWDSQDSQIKYPKKSHHNFPNITMMIHHYQIIIIIFQINHNKPWSTFSHVTF